MRFSGRRLTLVLTTLLVVLLAAGATAAWSFGRHRAPDPVAAADYRPGPSDDQTVQMSAAAQTHPRADEVRSVLQQYFSAINNRSYDDWMVAVAAAQSAPQTPERWLRDYQTTVDSNLAVMTIRDAPLRARMMFTSEQSIELAPPSLPSTCINWDVTYLLDDENGRLVLSGIDPSAQSMTACG